MLIAVSVRVCQRSGENIRGSCGSCARSQQICSDLFPFDPFRHLTLSEIETFVGFSFLSADLRFGFTSKGIFRNKRISKIAFHTGGKKKTPLSGGFFLHHGFIIHIDSEKKKREGDGKSSGNFLEVIVVANFAQVLFPNTSATLTRRPSAFRHG